MESSSRGFEDEVDFVDDDQRNAKSILSVPGAPIEIVSGLIVRKRIPLNDIFR